ncbi:MAG: circadian clock KaiB family protein [Desulfovibrionales bacterium]
MTPNDPKDHSKAFEQALQDQDGEQFVLTLYVTGATGRSMRAIAALKALCANELQGRCDVEVIDIYEHPELASEDQVVVIPTLIKKLPTPIRRLIGDLSDKEKVLKGLGIVAKK